MCSTLGEGAASDWLAIFLVDERQHSQAVGAAGFTVYALAMVVGRSAGTNIVERVGRVTALRTAGLLTAVGVALTLTVPADPATVVGIALWGLGLALVFPTAMSAAAERGETPAGGIAAVATLGYTGFLVGPPTMGSSPRASRWSAPCGWSHCSALRPRSLRRSSARPPATCDASCMAESLTSALSTLRGLLLDDASLVRAVGAGRRRGLEPPWRRVEARYVDLKTGRHLQVTAYDQARHTRGTTG